MGWMLWFIMGPNVLGDVASNSTVTDVNIHVINSMIFIDSL